MPKPKLSLLLNSLSKASISVLPFYKKLILLEYPKSGGTWISGLISDASSFVFTESLPSFFISNHLIHTHRLSLSNISCRSPIKILLVRNPFDTYISLYYHALFYNDKGNNVLVDYSRDLMKDLFNRTDFSYSFSNFLTYLFSGKFKYLTPWSTFYGRDKLDYFYVIRYEDLWDDTTGYLKSLFSSFELPYDLSRLVSSCSASRSKNTGCSSFI